MAVDESSFPRGGAAPTAATASNKANLFDQVQKKKKVVKNKIKKKKNYRAVSGAEPRPLALEDLSYRILNEGMVVLGCITEITDYSLHVSLPGLISGRVPVTQISEPYSQLLESSGQNDIDIDALCPLSELFYKGQLVTAKVWQIRQAEDMRHNVSLSLNPKVVHEDLTHSAMAKEGMIINAAVKSKEEHGYVMDCGVNGLRSFLKEDKALNYCNTFNGGRPLATGQLVRCIVTKAKSSSTASSVELSADPEDVANEEEAGHQSVDMQVLLPGMRFKLTVSESIIDGVEVKFHSLTGFIHRNHIPLDAKAIEPGLEEGTTLFGRVLYVTPLVKNVYLSALTNISSTVKEIPKPSPAEIHFKIGDIVPSGQVTGVGGKGLFLRLGKKNLDVRGFVPERRIGFNYKGKLVDNDDESSMLQRLRTKFPVGSSVRCRLLYFDAMSATYICSMEAAVLDEKYLSYSDVHVGDVVPCVVDGVKNGGIAVKVGMLSAFVPAAHSADVPLIHPAKKFQEGAKVTGRVLKIDTEKHRLIVTFKQSLVTSDDPIILSYQSARVGVCYLGTVVAISENGVFVSFFGNVKGFLEKALEFVPADHSFFIGQLIKCYVLKRNDNHLRLSMVAPNAFVPDQQACKNVEIGQMYALQVNSVTDKGLSVRVVDQGDSFNASGVIPVFHLSDDIQMAKLLLNTFEVGTVLTNTWCFSGAGPKRPAIFSMRSSVSQFFKSVRGQIASKKSIEALTPGMVLPCTIRKVDPSSLLLEVPLSSVRTLIRVISDNVCDKNETITSLEFVEGQAIQAKIIKVLGKSLVLDCRKKSVYKNDLETCIMRLSKHLSDQQRLLAHAKRISNPLGAYHIGKGVSGTVSEQTEWGFVLNLDNGARGETTFYNAHSENLGIGSRVQGKVLHVDCVRGHVEVTLRKDICATLKPYTKENMPSLDPDVQLRGPTLLATPEFILLQLKGAGKLNLAYIPTFLYPQSMQLTVPEPFFGLDRKVIIKRFTGRLILCLPKEVVKFYSRKKPQIKKEKKSKKVKKTKVKKEKNNGDRYFTLDKDIKQEREEQEEEEEEEEEVSQRIWDTENDIKIIDKDVDEISDDESAPLTEDEPDSDLELLAFDEQTLPVDGKENLSQSDELKARKRKLSSGSLDEKAPVSSNKKTKKESENIDAASSKTKTKRKGNDEISNSKPDGIKRKKNDDKKEEETVDLASDNKDDSSQQIQQILEDPISSSKKTKKEKEKIDGASSKTRKKIEGNDEMTNSKPDGTKRKKNNVEKEEETVDQASDNKDDSSQQIQQILKDPMSSSKKTQKEKEKIDGASSKTKNKIEGNDEMSNSNSDGIKRKKNNVEKEKETVDLASGNRDDSSEKIQQTLKNPGFMWDIDPTKFMQVLEPGKQDSSSDEDESDDEKSKKKKRKKSAVERREAARLEEERLQKIEKELLDPNRQLTSCDDFDRMVLANPDSSAVWLQYMAFHLQATEIEKARAVAQRAIKSISYREEQEKLNIWLGLLNLENLYGTPESLKTVLDEALQLNDAYKIRLHMVRLYAESSKNKELESEVRLVVKKFKETRGMWQDLGGVLMSQGYPEKARSILQQALQILKNKKDSVDLIVHFALLEARNNHLEQAKALMDPILASYPKRTDVWCTYCDMLVKANQINEARELLERSVSQKLPAKKMKTLFTKFLQFETAHGSKEGQDKVRLMATEYVKNAAGDD